MVVFGAEFVSGAAAVVKVMNETVYINDKPKKDSFGRRMAMAVAAIKSTATGLGIMYVEN